jgi:ribosomal protein S24E
MSAQETEYQMSIIEDRANPLVERRELKIEIASKSTPKRDAVRKAVASSLKVPIERVFVKSTLSSYGTNISVCKIHVYNSDERGKVIEPNYVQLRNLSREERKNTINAQIAAKAAAAKPAEEKAATGTKVT